MADGRCSRCSKPHRGEYGLLRMDDFWSDWDTRAELCKPCFDTVRAVLSGGEPVREGGEREETS